MDPVSIALLASAGISAIGKVLGGVGGYSAGKAQATALRAGADQARAEAGIEAQLGLEDADRTEGRAATLAAASGGGLTGSALDVLDDLERQSQFRAKAAIYRGEMEARSREYEARVAKRQGAVSLVTGITGAGATALGAFGQAAQQRRLA